MDARPRGGSAALGLRKANGLRVRLPLPSLTVATPDAAGAGSRSSALLADEVNVQRVVLVDLADTEGHSLGVSRRLTVSTPERPGPGSAGRCRR